MRLNRAFLIFEIAIIIVYISIILFSIVIQPINMILGIICVLFLPGYNLLNIIKPRFNLIEKLGYMTIISLALGNILMFFSYIFLYNFVTTTENPAFFFNNVLLIISIQCINLALIFLIEIRGSKIKLNNIQSHEKVRMVNFSTIKSNIKIRVLIIFIIFFLSLLFLCISTTYSEVPYYYKIGIKENFTFFYRVPPYFYIFLTFTVLSLTYIIIFYKNIYIILFSISAFMYCLWILPYLQIGNYFCDDPKFLYYFLKGYQIYGIRATEENSIIYRTILGDYFYYRNSTNIFTGIILIFATGVNIDIALWYLYPLIFIFIPFFFYSVFKNFSTQMDKSNLTLIILTILAIFTPQFLKYAHSATTGVIGLFILFILLTEYFNFMNKLDIELKIKDIFFIIFLFFFLCLTRSEECFIFLCVFIFYSIYWLFFRVNQMNEKDNFQKIKLLKKNHYIISLVLCCLSLIFYFTTEFFGYILQYFYNIFQQGTYRENIIYILYENTKFKLHYFLRGGLSISIFFIGSIIIGTIIFIIVSYVISFKFYGSFCQMIKTFLKIFKKIHFFLIDKLISKKYFQIFFFPIFFGGLLISNVLIIQFLSEQGLLLIIELIGSYSIFVFNIFLFIKGTMYYKVNNHKQNYFLLAILLITLMTGILFIVGNLTMSFYIFNARFFSYFIFFNLIIIQNNYFNNLIDKKKLYLFLLIVLLIFLGIYTSLRKLGYG